MYLCDKDLPTCLAPIFGAIGWKEEKTPVWKTAQPPVSFFVSYVVRSNRGEGIGLFCNQRVMEKSVVQTASSTVQAYAAPVVEVLEVNVESGYSASYPLGGGDGNATGNDYEWGGEIEL